MNNVGRYRAIRDHQLIKRIEGGKIACGFTQHAQHVLSLHYAFWRAHFPPV
ncbi:Uncharacterised protein [Vibrio cholerae]|nr:Uncharacterised protein [Vibrio cholerae]